MTHLGYILAAWLITFAVLGLYTLSVLTRGRSLSRQVPPERRRWSTSGESGDDQ
jgi:hypothetical protein